jgi:hypothetical protein
MIDECLHRTVRHALIMVRQFYTADSRRRGQG